MMFSVLFPVISLAIIIGIIFVIAVAIKAGNKNISEDEGGEDMIRNIYVYLVLFATLMMSIGGSVAAFMAVADLVSPAPYYQSYEDFRRWEVNEKYEYEDEEKDRKIPSEEELRDRYDFMVEGEMQKQKVQAKNSLIKSLGWIIIPAGIFITFQRRLMKNKA
ncbi:MAG: hypothetical protein GX366_04750 [Epulopiscium sp.]|nr:hypothetical protein [Candidatus Epulonipiscium sp.]